MKTLWTGRAVGDAGAIILSDADTAFNDLKDRLLDIDVEEAEHLTAAVLTDEARQYAMGPFGLSVEFDSERSAEAIYEYLQGRGEPVTKGRTPVSLGTVSLVLGDDRGESGDEALAGAWCRCGDEDEGWITAEYLYIAAHEN